MKEIIRFTVDEENVNIRIDKLISHLYEDFSRSFVKSGLENNLILVNNKSSEPSYKVKLDDEISIELPENQPLDIKPENLNLNIVYQDEDVVVVDKPKNMTVHPAPGVNTGTLVNGLLYEIKDLSGINGVLRPGIVHRIDKDTTGLLMVAKNDIAHNFLAEQLKNKSVTRRYIALVDGVIPNEKGHIDMPIGHDPNIRTKMAVVQDGKNAVTNFKVLERFKSNTLIECILETGRTHQIRVHMKQIGYPVHGDPIYGAKKTDTSNGQFLHAKVIGFIHPTTHEYLEFTSPLPEYFENYLEELRKNENR